MFAEERYKKIIEILRKQGFAKVEDLSKVLKVSEMTIRRDLEKCQNAGILRRCHGGAVIAGAGRQEVSFDDKKNGNNSAKKQIARTCADFVKEGMSVFLDAGTTAYEIAQLLRTIPRLTIVSNDIRIIYSLLNSEARLLLVGGEVQKLTGSIIGQLSDQMMSNIFVDIVFFGVNSINENFDVMTPTVEKAYFKRLVLQNADISYLAADHSKFRRNALYMINGANEYTGVVTDCDFTPGEKEIICKKKINIISVNSVKREV